MKLVMEGGKLQGRGGGRLEGPRWSRREAAGGRGQQRLGLGLGLEEGLGLGKFLSDDPGSNLGLGLEQFFDRRSGDLRGLGLGLEEVFVFDSKRENR